ncbi:hypothetical protein LZ32DRAFT_687524 [Colletotrichum eremochloae]|nr:hypothetical protein LZ32DRAFT_687524 [Colletotrichum eremochloae]
MADPWTIVGSASAILTFVEFAGKCVMTAKNLHQTGRTEDNASIENIMKKMQDLIDRVKLERAGTPTSEAEAGLFAIANQCEDLGRAILKRLHKAIKNEGSLRETIRASVSSVWNEKEVEDLQNQLQRCMTHFNTQMLALMRSETGHKLEQILAIQFSHSKEVDSLHDLITNLSTDQAGALDTLSSLRRLIGDTDSILERINQQRVLDALRVPAMKQRYDQVSDAAQGTFDWLVQSSEIPDHPELAVSLSTWLSDGKGIFHISGKPGSGKSTLMKLIDESEDAASLLDVWAGKEKLVKASVFIWKYGGVIQRTVIGVIRSLLFSILTELPDLLPKVLPKYWEPRRLSPWLPISDLHIAPKDVLQAFEHCIDPNGPAQHAHICLMLDGLDELNDPDELHTSFALRLMKWSNKNPSKLKICVSSREENAFMDNFPPQQRLRLHLITKGDVHQLITTRLNGHPRFRTFPERDRDLFCSQIAARSSGVFLWVKLVLNEIYENLDQQRSFEALETTLNQVPEEFEDFIFKIFSSIRKKDREEAYLLFLLAPEFDFAPALVFSFVEDILALGMDDHQAGYHLMTLEDLEIRHANFAARLRGLSRGLLEITTPGPRGLNPFKEDPHHVLAFGSRLWSVHRSINDWLLYSMPATLVEFRNTIDKEGVFLKCLIRYAQFVPWVDGTSIGYHEVNDNLIKLMLKSPAFATNESVHMVQLGKLEHILQEKYRKHAASTNLWNTRHQYSSSIWNGSLLQYSCEHYFVPFVNWGLRNLAWAQETRTRVQLLNKVCDYSRNGDWSRPREFELCLGVFFELGVDPNSECGEQGTRTSTPWLTFLVNKIKRDIIFFMLRDDYKSFGQNPSPGMRQLLEADADPRIFLVWQTGKQWSGYKVIWDPNYRSNMNTFTRKISQFSHRSKQQQEDMDVSREIEFLRKIRIWPLYEETEDEVTLQMTLRELVQACLPEDAGTLLPLIDRNLARRDSNCHTPVDEGSVIIQPERHHIQGQHQECGNETKAKEKDVTGEIVRNETQVGLFDTWKLAVIFMVLGVCLGILLAKLF